MDVIVVPAAANVQALTSRKAELDCCEGGGDASSASACWLPSGGKAVPECDVRSAVDGGFELNPCRKLLAMLCGENTPGGIRTLQEQNGMFQTFP